MSDMQTDRVLAMVEHLYHKSIVKHPGGLKYEYNGRKIKPMSPSFGAESAGMKVKDFCKRIDPNQQERPFLESWVRNLMDGMDKASLDVLENNLGRVAFTIPASASDAESITCEAIELGKEAGDVFAEISKSTCEKSEDGINLSSRERARIANELRDVIAKSCAMLQSIEGE